MFVCLYCNLQSTNERAQICQNCGPSKKWLPIEVDQSDGLRKYYAAAREFIFDPEIGDEMFDFQSGNLREKFKISYLTNSKIISSLKKKRDAISALNKFKLEFDENVIDAYAGQETLLRFRFTNQSDNELIKVHLHWDDPDTPDDLDFNLRSLNYIKPKQSTILAGNHIFTRFGFKEISDLQAIISDPEQKNAKFIVSPFNFKIANVGQTIINNITKNTTQNISIEGRGVVDASGSSANESQNLSNQTKSPVWKTLSVTYQSNEDNDFIESLINSLKAAEDSSDSTEKKKISLKTTLRDEVESLFYGLKDFNQLLPQRDLYRIVPALDISLHLLEVFHFKDLEAELDNLIGVAFENPQKVELDSDNFIDNFSGEATLITTTGLTILNNQDNLVNWTISYAWNQLKPNGLCFYRQRFGPGAYLISFGNESFKANVPGLKFDLRRYQGIESIELKYDKIDQTLSNILLLAPKASEISPRLNDESVHVQPPAFEETSFTPTNLIQATVSELTSCIEKLRHFEDSALEDECGQFTADFISDSLKEVISTVVPGCTVGDIYGIMIEDPNGNYIDPDSDTLHNFEGSASVVTVHGLSAIACINNSISFETQVSWVDAENCGLRIWVDSDGNGQFICFGLNNNGDFQHLYGCRWAVNNYVLADYAIAVGTARQALSRVYDLASGRGEFASPESQGQVLSDGSIYSGQFDQNDKCTGYASYSWFSGERYTGDFLNGQYNGQGEIQFADGRRYVGSWVNGQKNGYGVFSYANGDIYEGEFVNDDCHGDGKYTFPNGDFYTGNFANGCYDGIGTFAWANGTEYTGEWSVGVKHGRGLITFPDGQTQEGTWDNDVYRN